MSRESAIAVVTRLGSPHFGTFRGCAAVAAGVSRKQLMTLQEHGAVERVLADTYRLTGAPRSHDQMLCASLLWAGESAVAAGRSAGMTYRLEGVRTEVPEIAVPEAMRRRAEGETVTRYRDRRELMVRTVQGIPVTGVEATLVRLAHVVDAEALETAWEDARRRRLTSVPALHTYLDRYGTQGRQGIAVLRGLLDQLDPAHPARSTLEVMTRRLLVAHGITNFVREYPLECSGRLLTRVTVQQGSDAGMHAEASFGRRPTV